MERDIGLERWVEIEREKETGRVKKGRRVSRQFPKRISAISKAPFQRNRRLSRGVSAFPVRVGACRIVGYSITFVYCR